jgi:hypothetical protein
LASAPRTHSVGMCAVVPRHAALGLSHYDARSTQMSFAGVDLFVRLAPSLARLAPVVPRVLPGELRWLTLERVAQPLWDNAMCADRSSGAQARELVGRAMRGPLSAPELQRLRALFALDPRLVRHCGLSPQRLPALVEKNPDVAHDIILRLRHAAGLGGEAAVVAMDDAATAAAASTAASSAAAASASHSRQHHQSHHSHHHHHHHHPPGDAATARTAAMLDLAYDALADMPLSLHSLDVMNRLSQEAALPKHVLHRYVTNSITSCALITDKYLQNRLVRLLCVFLKSHIRSGVFNVSEAFVEVQAFCIEFSRVREAVALYRHLKSVEPGVITEAVVIGSEKYNSMGTRPGRR